MNLKIFEKPTGQTLAEEAIIRVDEIKYKTLYDLYNKSLGLFWTVNIINFDDDRAGFDRLPSNVKDIFLINNSYQLLADSVVTNLFPTLSDLSNTPEGSLLYSKIAFDESIHAQSYSSGLTKMFGTETTKILNEQEQNPFIMQRLDNEIDYGVTLKHNPDYEDLFKALVAIFFLEHFKFPFSFFITLNISNSYNVMGGFNELISRIALDEMNIHAPTGIFIIREMIKDHGNTFSQDPYEIIKDMGDFVLEEEIKWNQYLSSLNPTTKGYNTKIGEEFILYRYNLSLRRLGVKVDQRLSEPLSHKWFDEYRNVDNNHVSQQEAKSTSYQRGVLVNDL